MRAGLADIRLVGWVKECADRGHDQSLLLVALYALVFGAIYFLIDLPLSYYSGFVLPHRFGQSNETLRGWVMDQIKGIW